MLLMVLKFDRAICNIIWGSIIENVIVDVHMKFHMVNYLV